MNLAVRGGCLKVIRGDEHWCVLLTLPCTQGPQRAPPQLPALPASAGALAPEG